MLKNNGKDAILSALAFWGKNGINGVATEISDNSVENVTGLINTGKAGLDERIRFFKKAVEILKVEKCKPKGELTTRNEKGTIVVVSGVSNKLGVEKSGSGKQWPVYETSVYQNMTLKTYNKLSDSNKLPKADYTTYLTRDAHMASSDRSAKRYGTSNETPPGVYFLNKGIKSQKYHIYLSDTQGIGSSSISGTDGYRGGVAIHGGWPQGTIGCLSTHTANYGNKNPKPPKKPQPINPLVQELIDNIPDFEDNNDDKPVMLILEERKATKKDKLWYGEIE